MNSIREQKELSVKEIREKLANSRSTIFADYKGLNVARVTELRKRMRAAGVEMKVVKNTLTRIAASELGYGAINSKLEGPTAAIFGVTDPVAPAKVLDAFSKEFKFTFDIKGGIVEGKVIGTNDVKALAELPSKEVLIAKALGTLQAPIVGFLNVLQGNARELVYVLEAIRKQKEGSAS